MGRYFLQPRRDVRAAALTTLMPYQGALGPVQLAARTLRPHGRLPADPRGLRRALGNEIWMLGLYHAQRSGPWHRFANLTLRPAAAKQTPPSVSAPASGCRNLQLDRGAARAVLRSGAQAAAARIAACHRSPGDTDYSGSTGPGPDEETGALRVSRRLRWINDRMVRMAVTTAKILIRADRQCPVIWLLEESGAKTVPLLGIAGLFRSASRFMIGLIPWS